MDGSVFDALIRSFARRESRRGLLRFLAGVPLANSIVTLLPGEADAAGRRRRRKRRHKHRSGDHGHRKGKGKKGCVPQSAAQTCAGTCGSVRNNCGRKVDCGSCGCATACPACQTCNPTTGRCETNQAYLGQVCAATGQTCQADGTCTCDAGSCAAGQRCNGLACICDGTSCPSGCCDGAGTCHVGDVAACGTGGGSCQECSGVCVSGVCATCSPANPCPAGMCCANGVCVASCPDCQICNGTGQCEADAGQNRFSCRAAGGGAGVCCSGVCCAGCCDASETCGACIAFVTSSTNTGNLGGLVGADRICRARAEAVNLPGTYKAWLSDDTRSPSTRFRCRSATCSSEGYTLVNGDSIAGDWAELTSGTLAVPLNRTEANVELTDLDSPATWTHTLPDGSPGGVGNTHCENWTNRFDTSSGDVGFTLESDSDWTSADQFSCDFLLRLYCFQQD